MYIYIYIYTYLFICKYVFVFVEFYVQCSESNISICIHICVCRVRNTIYRTCATMSKSTLLPRYLEQVLLDFPDLVVVAGHIGAALNVLSSHSGSSACSSGSFFGFKKGGTRSGAPWLDEMLFLAGKFQNLYIDTSAYVPSRLPAVVKCLVSKLCNQRWLRM